VTHPPALRHRHPLSRPLLQAALSLGCLLACAGLSAENGQDPQTPVVSTEGAVHAIALSTDGTTAYLGGSMDYIGYRGPNLAALDATTGIPAAAFPWSDNTVSAVISDGAGGWWVAGGFGHLGSSLAAEVGVNNLAHILSNNSVVAVPLSFNSSITCMALFNNSLYVGGNFTAVSGYTRQYAAAINVGSSNFGQLLPWNPSASSSVSSIAEAGLGGSEHIFLGGGFTSINGVHRNYLAEVTTDTGLPTVENMQLSYPPGTSVSQSGTNLFYCSNSAGFSTGFDKHGLASYSSTGSVPLDTFPEISGANDTVNACITDGGTGWYVGGSFTVIGGSSACPYLAHVLASGAIDPAFAPLPNGQVSTLLLVGGTLYFGGTFTLVDTFTRNYVAAVSTSNGALTTWDPEANAQVYTLLSAASSIWVGGDFSKIGSAFRPYLAQLDTTLGQATTWDLAPNNDVHGLANINNTLFVGGYHANSISSYTAPYLTALTATNTVNPAFPATNGAINAMISDGNSGWYVGGNFSQIGAQSISYLAHVLSNFSIDATFQSSANGQVFSLATSNDGNTLYVGGSFSAIGGAPRSNLASLSLVSGSTYGQAINWAPNPNSNVYAISVAADNTIFAGGYFSTIGGQPRSYLAQLDPASAQASTFNPSPNGYIYALTVIGSRIFVGGGFSVISGDSTTSYLCSFTTATGTRDSWLAGCNYTVDCLLADGASNLRVGGAFNLIGGASRGNVADISTAPGTAVATTWNPGSNTTVNCLAAVGTGIAVGGSFNTIGGASRSCFAEVDTNTGLALAANPSLDNTVNCIAVSGSVLALGGTFRYSQQVPYNGIAAYDIPSMTAVSGFNDGTVDGNNINCLTVSNGNLYAGGDFSQIGGALRTGVGCLTPTTGAATAFNPVLNGQVQSLGSSGNTLYLGGTYYSSFSSFNGTTRTFVGAVDETSFAATSFNPALDSVVYAITPSTDGMTVVVGGDFSFSGDQNKSSLFELDSTTGLITSWAPGCNGGVYGITVDGTTLFATGSFSSLGGQSRQYMGAVDTGTALATAWAPSPNTYANALGVLPGVAVYASGGFTTVKSVSRNGLVAMNETDGTPTAWNPGCRSGSSINCIVPTASTVIVGGSQDWYGGFGVSGLAAINVTTGAPVGWAPNVSGSVVSAIAVNGTTVYVGGTFSQVNGQNRGNLAAVDGSSGIVSAWNDNTTGPVDALAIIGNTLYVGGSYSGINGTSTPNLAGVDLTSGTNTAFAPNPDSTVDALAVSGTLLYAGGSFAHLGATVQSSLAAFDTTTGLATSWAPNANGLVRSLFINGGTIYAGGDFTTITTQTQPYVAAINGTGSLNATWQPSVNTSVYAMSFGNSDLLIGGSFTYVDGLNVNPEFNSINPLTATAFGSWPTPAGNVYALLRIPGTNNVLVGGTFPSFTSKYTGATIYDGGIAIEPLTPLPNPGDLNGDGVVNQADVDLVISHFGYRITDPGWDPQADANGDGVVNVDDLNIVLSNLGNTYP